MCFGLRLHSLILIWKRACRIAAPCFLFFIGFQASLFGQIGFAQTQDSFSVILISGDKDELIEDAAVASRIAFRMPICNDIRILKSPKIDRLIAVFDTGLTSQLDGKKTIEPIVNKINADQNVAIYQREGSDLKIDDMINICNYLPWNADELPSDVEFYHDFRDPMRLTSFHTVIVDIPEYLRFLEYWNNDLENLRYYASTKLRVKESDQVVSILLIERAGGGFSDEDLKNKEWPIPVKMKVIDSKIFLLANFDSQDSATKFLNNWIDSLERASPKD